jgi:ribosomal protein L3
MGRARRRPGFREGRACRAPPGGGTAPAGVSRRGVHAACTRGSKKDSRATRAELGHFKEAGASTAAVVREFRVSAEVVAGLEAGKQLAHADFLKGGQRVDVRGVSKGKGFAGVMKRLNFSGFKASHRVHEY